MSLWPIFLRLVFFNHSVCESATLTHVTLFLVSHLHCCVVLQCANIPRFFIFLSKGSHYLLRTEHAAINVLIHT